MKTIHKLVPLILIIGMGCITNTEDLTPGDDPGNEEPIIENVSYANQVQPIFNGNCTGCHGSSGGLNLSSYTQLMNSAGSNYSGRIVVAGDANASGLVDKIEVNPDFPQRMPVGGTLSNEEIEIIRVWINEGAQNN